MGLVFLLILPTLSYSMTDTESKSASSHEPCNIELGLARDFYYLGVLILKRSDSEQIIYELNKLGEKYGPEHIREMLLLSTSTTRMQDESKGDNAGGHDLPDAQFLEELSDAERHTKSRYFNFDFVDEGGEKQRMVCVGADDERESVFFYSLRAPEAINLYVDIFLLTQAIACDKLEFLGAVYNYFIEQGRTDLWDEVYRLNASTLVLGLLCMAGDKFSFDDRTEEESDSAYKERVINTMCEILSTIIKGHENRIGAKLYSVLVADLENSESPIRRAVVHLIKQMTNESDLDE